MLQDPLQCNSVAQNIHGEINIHLLHNHLTVQFSPYFNWIDLQNCIYGEIDVINLKYDSEYHIDPDLR